MEALIAVDQEKVYLALGYPSLFRYACEALQLSEAVAYSSVAVARKANVVPALRAAVGAGELGFSKAKKVLSVLNANIPEEEQTAWVSKAVHLSSRTLEKEVARVQPLEAIPERAVYRSEKRLELKLGVAEEILLDFRRAQDRLSSTRSQAVSLEETLGEVLRFYLQRKDPETRARRVIAKKGIKSRTEQFTGTVQAAATKQFTGAVETTATKQFTGTVVQATTTQQFTGTVEATVTQQFTGPVVQATATKQFIGPVRAPTAHPAPKTERKPLAAALLHKVRLRDRGQCQFLMPSGKPCASRRWIEIHHRVPLSQGGGDTLMNLVSLCRAHHQAWHHRAH